LGKKTSAYPSQNSDECHIFRIDLAWFSHGSGTDSIDNQFNGDTAAGHVKGQLQFSISINSCADDSAAVVSAGYANNQTALQLALTNGNAVKLTKDIALSSTGTTIAVNPSATIDLNGHTITGLSALIGLPITSVTFTGSGSVDGTTYVNGVAQATP
jgi:hypothetical protein